MMKRAYSAILSFLLLFILIFSNVQITAHAQEDPVIVVSLGDSYASGEGLGYFYGEDKSLSEKIYDEDWIAHRSKISWGAQLEVGNYGMTGNARKTSRSNDDYQWYFAAASGAESRHVYSEPHYKKVRKNTGALWWKETLKNDAYLPVQTEIFDNFDYGTVDYVTMSIGGNDVHFADIMKDAAKKSTYLGNTDLETRLNGVWANVDNTMRDLKSCYQAVENAAGPQAKIIITGYPILLEYNGAGALFSQKESRMIDNKVMQFNQKIEEAVGEMGDNFYFVDIASAFNVGSGHAAYTLFPWINEIVLKQAQDINDENAISDYSFHPNILGVVAYADEVNKVIANFEAEKDRHYGTLSGKVCMATDRVTPVASANIIATGENRGNVGIDRTNDTGNYEVKLTEDTYSVRINAPGFIPFTAYADVKENENTYMETFLLVAGQVGETGIAKGKITNAITGVGVPDAQIEVRDGWNNKTRGDVLAVTQTDSNGNYELGLPLGNYTLNISKNGFISGTTNIIVQSGVTADQNGSISPLVTGEDFRIVLTWGENPRDLDSHVVGNLSNGSRFHVYYSYKSQYDGGVEICNLDVDDTTSYGPETITLSATQSAPYYYYIHRYAGSGYISTSEAMIMVYQGSEPIAKFNVPTNIGNGDYWNVFAIVNGNLVVKNTMTDYPDTTYAGAPTRLLTRMAVSPLMMDLNLEGKGVKEGDELVENSDEKALIEDEIDELVETTEEISEEAVEGDTEAAETEELETEEGSDDEEVVAPQAPTEAEEVPEEATTETSTEEGDSTETETVEEVVSPTESITE